MRIDVRVQRGTLVGHVQIGGRDQGSAPARRPPASIPDLEGDEDCGEVAGGVQEAALTGGEAFHGFAPDRREGREPAE